MKKKELFVIGFSAFCVFLLAASAYPIDRPVAICPRVPIRQTGPYYSSLVPTFSWTLVDGASRYLIKVFEVGTPTPVICQWVEAGSSWTPSGDNELTPGTEYYWMVRAWNDTDGYSAWSPKATFTAGKPQESLTLEFCIIESEEGTLSEPEGGVGSFSLVDTGGPFFVVHAMVDQIPSPTDPDDKPILFSGTCQVCEGCMEGQSNPILFCNLQATQEHALKPTVPPGEPEGFKKWFDGRMWQLSLDLTTLNGDVWNVGIDYKKIIVSGEFDAGAGQFIDAYTNGTVTVVGGLPPCLIRYTE